MRLSTNGLGVDCHLRPSGRRVVRTQHLATAWSRSSVPFTTKVLTSASMSATWGAARLLPSILVLGSVYWTVLSVVAVEIGSSRRRAAAQSMMISGEDYQRRPDAPE
jgi:hypothetical protein